MKRIAMTISVTALSLFAFAANPTLLFAEDSSLPGAGGEKGEPIETSDGKAVEALPAVVVEGRGEDLLEIAESASVGRIGQAEFESRPLLRPGELLEAVPGVIVTQHSGSGKANQYFLRGFNLDHGTDFRTEVDGMPVNMPTHGHGQGYTDLNFLIPEVVQTIDYKKGVYYAEEGDFSSAGAADFSLFTELPQGLAELTIGEDSYQRLVVADSVKKDALSTLAAIEVQHYDGPWDLEEDLRKFNGMLRFAHGTPNDLFSLTFMGYHNSWDSTDQVPLRAIESGLISPLGFIDPTDGGNSSRYSVSGNWKQRSDSEATTANLYAIYYRLRLFSNFTYFLDDPINGDQFEQDDERVIIGGAASHEVSHDLLGLLNTTTYGIQLRTDTIPEVALRKTRAREEVSTVREDEVLESTVGVYAKNEVVLAEKLRANAGLRGDLFYFDVDSSIDENSGDDLEGKVSPKGGLVVGPWNKTEIYLNGGLGFHSNDARGTTIRVDPTSGEAADPVDPLVLSKGAEIGVRTTAIEGLNSTVSLWVLNLDSELLFVGDAGVTEPSRESRRYGIEFANYYRPIKPLIFDLDYSLSHARFRGDDPAGDEIPGAIESVVAAGVTAEMDRFFGTMRVRHFGERPLIEDNSVKSDATTLVNAEAGVRFDDWKLSLQCLNLFDSEDSDIDYFYPSRLLGEPEEGVEDIHLHPVEPRTIRVAVNYRF